MMNMLDLFAGTGSISKIFKERGWNTISLDRDLPADINIDILNWDYKKQFKPKHFYYIWASPPCTEYSMSKTQGRRNIKLANKIVNKTIEIIEYLEPVYYTIENPQTGYLKDQVFMDGIPFDDVDYCKYGFPYRKRTRLWNNINRFRPRPLCQQDCRYCVDGKHIIDIESQPTKTLYRIPPQLVNEIIKAL